MQMAVASARQRVNVASIFTLLLKLQSSLKSDARTHRTPKALRAKSASIRFCERLGIAAGPSVAFSNHRDKSDEE
jgi:hypothetical protein